MASLVNSKINKKINTSQQGFTLVELMIALVLGLLVSAAALQIFVTSQKNLSLQQASSDIQSDSLFGLESVVRDIRLANLNASKSFIDDKVLHGGIVLSKNNYSNKIKEDGTVDITLTEVDSLSYGGLGPSKLKNQKSDVLVIQYRNILQNQFSCEGQALPKDVYVVQKYFLRSDTNRNDPNSPLSLACKAFTYTGDTPPNIDLSGNGEIIIPRVDHLSVLLGVAEDVASPNCTGAASSEVVTQDGRLDCFGYIGIEEYKKLAEKPQIVSIKLGMLVRAVSSNGRNKYFNKDQEFEILNTKAPLKEDAKNNLYMRNVVSQTIAIRNGFGLDN